jgi:cation diffusion facilitator family transporter
MDCPSEEQMIRLRLSDVPSRFMEIDIPGRLLVIGHAGDVQIVLDRLIPLGYGAELQASRPLLDSEVIPVADPVAESKVLWILLGINALMFVIESIAGWWAESAGLIADAADMFADAVVYGVALYAVGKDAKHKLSAARISGLFQLALAVGALSETGRRILAGSSPEEAAMIGVSLLALAANVGCLMLISRHRHQGVHMRASYIFSANDVLANLGVILAGGLVAWSGSPIPDWTIGLLIGAMVLVGSIRILKLQ